MLPSDRNNDGTLNITSKVQYDKLNYLINLVHIIYIYTYGGSMPQEATLQCHGLMTSALNGHSL